MFGKKEKVQGKNLDSKFEGQNKLQLALTFDNCHLNEDAPSSFSVTSSEGISVETTKGDITNDNITVIFTPSKEGNLSITLDVYVCQGEKCAKKGFIIEHQVSKGTNSEHSNKIQIKM